MSTRIQNRSSSRMTTKHCHTVCSKNKKLHWKVHICTFFGQTNKAIFTSFVSVWKIKIERELKKSVYGKNTLIVSLFEDLSVKVIPFVHFSKLGKTKNNRNCSDTASENPSSSSTISSSEIYLV